MYNRYINNSFEDFFTPISEEASDTATFVDVEPAARQPPPEPAGISGLFSNLKLPDLNTDTIILLVLVWFLVAEENESISDTLLIIGVLLLMGL